MIRVDIIETLTLEELKYCASKYYNAYFKNKRKDPEYREKQRAYWRAYKNKVVTPKVRLQKSKITLIDNDIILP